jgi:alkaline phosphatase D
VPEGPINLDVAKIVADSAIGSRIFVLKKGFDPLEAAKKPTMLGAKQKEWLNDVLWQSTATWKVWGSETQLSQMLAQLARFKTLPEFAQDTFYLTTDQWDGYRSERAEILGRLETLKNLVVITGDIHAFYASELHVDFDEPAAKPVGVEYVVAGITSQAIAPAAKSVLDNPSFANLGLADLIPQFDEILKEGSPWYKYANSFENGIAVVDVTEDKFAVEFLVVSDVIETAKPALKRVKLQTLSGTNKVEVV